MFAEIRELEQLGHWFRLVTDGIFNIWIGIFCDLYIGTITLYVRFIVVYNCIVRTVCALFVLFYFSDKNTPRPSQRQSNWQQTQLPTARRPSRANGGASVPAPMVALLIHVQAE